LPYNCSKPDITSKDVLKLFDVEHRGGKADIQNQFVKRPVAEHCPNSKLERDYRRADAAIDQMVELLHAA